MTRLLALGRDVVGVGERRVKLVLGGDGDHHIEQRSEPLPDLISTRSLVVRQTSTRLPRHRHSPGSRHDEQQGIRRRQRKLPRGEAMAQCLQRTMRTPSRPNGSLQAAAGSSGRRPPVLGVRHDMLLRPRRGDTVDQPAACRAASGSRTERALIADLLGSPRVLGDRVHFRERTRRGPIRRCEYFAPTVQTAAHRNGVSVRILVMSRSASATVVRCVFALGRSGITDASQTRRPV